jgi:hypothetical protein
VGPGRSVLSAACRFCLNYFGGQLVVGGSRGSSSRLVAVVVGYKILTAACPAATFLHFAPNPSQHSQTPLFKHFSLPSFCAMVSVCGTCQGLQKHLKALENPQEVECDTLQWVNTSLPQLRTSASNCRACALLLNGVLLHHERFAGVKEDTVRLKAESFSSKPGRTFQDHLSVEIRWKEQDAPQDDCQDDQHEHPGYPDLKLEFFTDGGRWSLHKLASTGDLLQTSIQLMGRYVQSSLALQ